MTLPRLEAFTKLWKRHPPKQWLLEIAVHWKATDDPKTREYDDFGGLIAMFGSLPGCEVELKGNPIPNG